MAEFTGSNTFTDNIYLLEPTDLVLGGLDGISNKAIRQLAERTNWLRKANQGYAGITTITTGKALTKEDILFKLVVVNANSASIECVLPALSADDAGIRISLVAYNVTKQVAILSPGVNNILFGSNLRQRMFMGSGDSLELIWLGTSWMVFEAKGNFAEVGTFLNGYSVLPNTAIANGALLKRSDYPRLWEYVSGVTGSLVAESYWGSVPGYSGFFSAGDGSTNFRLPDLRGMFIRSLDLGKGISYGRNLDEAGGYEADEFKSHNHALYPDDRSGRSDNANDRDVMIPGGNGRLINTTSVGGQETRPKNIGLIPLIKI